MKILKSSTVLFLLFLAFGITSCEKAEIKDGGGKTLVKLKDGGEDPVVLPLDVSPPVEKIKIADVRKDAVSEADANTATTVTIVNSQPFLDSINNEWGTAYELLPAGAYTITPESGVTVNGNTWTINLAAGELAREIYINLDKTQMDLSLQYAFGLKITKSTVGSPSLAQGFEIVNVLVKNKYDGNYEVTGTMNDVANSALTADYPMDYDLITTGERSVVGWSVKNEYYYVDILNNGAESVYGSFCPEFLFDANDNVIAVTNAYGQPAGNGRYAQIDPSGVNKWDAGTGNIDVKFFMFQPSVVPLPDPRVSFDWHMAYKGPR